VTLIVIGLGANLGDPATAFAAALQSLAGIGTIAGVSRLYSTRPEGPEQPHYTNAAALLEWPTGSQKLLEACKTLERSAGRDRSFERRWGPRALDLDLLIARSLVFRSPAITLPHPRFHLRAFALAPAAELVPDWVHPVVGRTIGELAAEVRAADPDALLSSEPFPVR
jgi:2-amino-4-hydroxy-6-hydroxymethyldihydropteridine diphosphokinase